jgi:hypothetical protein
MPTPSLPHFGFPFTRTATGVQTVEQRSTEHIMAQEDVVAYCPLGYREDRPEFGWPWPDLALMPIDTKPLIRALNTFVPDATATVARAQELASGVFEIDVNVTVAPSGDDTGASQGVD